MMVEATFCAFTKILTPNNITHFGSTQPDHEEATYLGARSIHICSQLDLLYELDDAREFVTKAQFSHPAIDFLSYAFRFLCLILSLTSIRCSENVTQMS